MPSSGRPTALPAQEGDPCVTVGAACRQDMDPVGLCPFSRRSVLRGAPGARAQLVSQLCHRCVSQDESESLWAEPSPRGVTALRLPALPPSRVLGAGASLHEGHPEPPVPAQGSPAGAQTVAGAERASAPLFLSTTGEMS